MSKFISVSGNFLLTGKLNFLEDFVSQLLLGTLEGCQALGLGHAKAIIEQGDSKLFASTTGLPAEVDFKGSRPNTSLGNVGLRVTVIMVKDFSRERLEEIYLSILSQLEEKFEVEIRGEKLVKH